MKNIFTLSVLTFREALSQRIFQLFFGISTFIILITALVFVFISSGSFSASLVVNSTSPLGGSLATGVKFFLIYPLYGGGLFLAIFSVSGIIPSLLEKGNIDLILSKPVSRSQIILGKYFGGIAIVFVNIFYAIVAIWFLIGLKFGVWDLSFVATSITITLAFSAIYSVIILIGITTRSSVFSMIFAYLTFFILSPILASREGITAFINNGFVNQVFTLFYYLIPQTSDLSSITSDLVVGNSLANPLPIFTSIVYIILILSISISIFKKKDF